jgi:AcrR family transcriptional regulator
VTAKLAVYGLTVRDIAREALVADGVLYNYFQDKEDLLAHALLAHVGMVMGSAPPTLEAGSGTVAENLGLFIDRGFALLARVTPAFAGLLAQQGVLSRFHAMVGGDEAFGAVTADDGANPRDSLTGTDMLP